MTPVWRRRRWIVGHVICLSLIVVFVNCGLWQMHRLAERRAHNALLEARMSAAAEPLDRLLASGADTGASDYRRTTIDGTWLPNSTMLVRSRSLSERPGYHVLAILVTGRDSGVVVNRGFAPIGGGGEDTIRAAVAPRSSTGRINGIVRPTETRQSIGPKDPDEGRLTVLNRIDVARIQHQTSIALAPAFVQAEIESPSHTGFPEALPLPDVGDEGPHLDYTGQWFLFATIGAIGWPFVVRRAARGEAEAQVVSEDEPALAG